YRITVARGFHPFAIGSRVIRYTHFVTQHDKLLLIPGSDHRKHTWFEKPFLFHSQMDADVPGINIIGNFLEDRCRNIAAILLPSAWIFDQHDRTVLGRVRRKIPYER